MHVQGLKGLSAGRSPAAWNVFLAATKYACLRNTAASSRGAVLLLVASIGLCAGTGVQCSGLCCMEEALWGLMSQEAFIKTCRASTPEDEQLIAAQLCAKFLWSACTEYLHLLFCRAVLVRRAFIL